MGPTGVGKRAVARALCDRLGVQLYRLDVRRLPPPGAERQEMLRLLEREAILLQTALYVDATEVDRTNQALAVSVGDVIERLSLFLIVGSTQRWLSERELLPVQVPKPDASGRHALWQQALAGIPHSINGQLEAIVQQFDFGPQMVAQAVSAAQGKARLHTPDADTGPTADDLWQACREQACWQLDELVQRILPCYTWEDIVVPEDLFRQLQEIAAQVAHRAQVYETWGFGQKLSRGRGLSALFAGPSGTGKTMAAEVLATHLNLDLYRIDLAGVVSKYIGETEKNLRKVFDAAEQSGAILFFDEADALFGKRTEVKDSHDRYANIEVNYLLQRMEDYRGLAILATNRKSDLDQAFLRRLRFLVDFPFPDADSRRRIWQKSFPPQAPLEQLDMTFLARLEIPGGNIKNIALNAAFLAAGEGTAIGMPQIMRATRREYAKIEKLITETEFGPYYRRGKP
jgi:AAA+ superfamily predicted ATPase